jgi:hypothetical protein
MEFYDPDIRVQAPSMGMFSYIDLKWTASGLCYIPWDRLSNFRDGEGRRDKFNEASFFIRNSDHQPPPGAPWLTKQTYWCAFGPDVIANCDPAVPPMHGTSPKEGIGSRPKARKSLFNNHMKRGCQCHFFVKRFKDYADVAVIYYPTRYAHVSSFLFCVM